MAFGALAMVMRAQLAQPSKHLLTPQVYNEFFTLHGTGMISLVMTPFALALGIYLAPLEIGAPMIAAPRTALLGYWLYLAGAVVMIWGFLSPGATAAGWWAYTPLSDTVYSPGDGMDLWIAGVFLAGVGMILLAGSILWTILRMRAPGMTMMRIPVFAWTMVVTALMVLAAFPSLLVAMGMLVMARIDPGTFSGNQWNVAYQHLFWFYGHPVVYIMFFPFVGCVAEVLSVFSSRRFFGYKGTVLSLLAFAALSMSVWGHHMFATGQVTSDYYSLTSIMLALPAGIEYFSMLGTLVGGRHRYPTPMLFAIAFLPQFLIGGLTGIMAATPTIGYQVNNSYFIVAHFHYTLVAGSLFGFFAGLYFWFPKATGVMFDERLGKLHFVLMVIGTNVAFLPMFGLGYLGMPRRVVSYPASAGFTTLSFISSIGAFILGLAMLTFVYNLYIPVLKRVPAPADPWDGHTLEWATSSPPPLFNFGPPYPVPPIRSYAPLLDLRERSLSARAER